LNSPSALNRTSAGLSAALTDLGLDVPQKVLKFNVQTTHSVVEESFSDVLGRILSFIFPKSVET
jgi:hypothetical protein